jgi:hypothetical protein
MRRMVLAQRLGGVADLALAGQEHQHVAGTDAASSSTASTTASIRSRCSRSSAGAAFGTARACATSVETPLRSACRWADSAFHRIQAARDLDHRRRPISPLTEMAGEAVGVDGGRGDDDLQVGRAAAAASGSRAGNRCSGCARAPRR